MSSGTDPAALSSLRELVGPTPPTLVLETLLMHHRGDISAAANAYFDGGATHNSTAGTLDGVPPVARPVPAAAAPPSEQGLVTVTVPTGLAGGDEIHVQTAAGVMGARVPAGLKPGDTFLMRTTPPEGRAPVAQARPVGAPSAYPGLHHQPQVAMQQQPVVHVVHSQPYYGGGYGYGGGMLMPFVGGMLMADLLWW